MSQRLGNAFLVFSEEGHSESEYQNVTILDSGWVKADVPMKSGSTQTAYFSPSKVERVYEP